MNGRLKTTQFPAMLRRPLLWAALCSIVLHLPVLALFSLQMSQNQPTPEEHVLLTLLPAAGSEQVAGAESHEQQVSNAESDSEPSADSDQEPLAQALQIDQAANSEQAPGVYPAPDTFQTSVVETRSDHIEAASTATDLAEPLQTPDTTTAEIITPLAPQALASTLALLPMAERDVSQVQTAIHNLLDRINHSGLESGLSSLDQIAPESLGLPVADQVTAIVVPVNTLTGLQQVDVAITRRVDGQLFQLRGRLQERALSHYAKFVNRWDDNVMLSNDLIDGRFHANSEVNFEVAANARPQFNGEVTIARRQPVSSRLRQSTMFAEGIRTGIGLVAMPRDSLPAHWLDTEATVLQLESDTRLQFEGSDGVTLTDIENNNRTKLQVSDSGLVIMGDRRKRIELAGTVSGQVLVYSPRQLLITGNLVYADNTADSTDMLALISDGSIEIAPVSVTGAGDLQIHGALFARQRFAVRRFRERHQGTLYIHGALVAGSISATEPRFHTHIRHDQRFDHSRPPAFPTTGLFDLLAWDQHWSAVNDADALFADVADNAPIVEP